MKKYLELPWKIEKIELDIAELPEQHALVAAARDSEGTCYVVCATPSVFPYHLYKSLDDNISKEEIIAVDISRHYRSAEASFYFIEDSKLTKLTFFPPGESDSESGTAYLKKDNQQVELERLIELIE